jgi:hypothetical protein
MELELAANFGGESWGELVWGIRKDVANCCEDELEDGAVAVTNLAMDAMSSPSAERRR